MKIIFVKFFFSFNLLALSNAKILVFFFFRFLEEKRMAELVKFQIEKEGKIDLRILKGLLLGGPGVWQDNNYPSTTGKASQSA